MLDECAADCSDSLLRCAVPIIVESPETPGYDYWVCGTGFLVALGCEAWLVATAHQGFAAARVFISLPDDLRTALPFDACVRCSPDSGVEDSDYCDIRLLRVAQGGVQRAKGYAMRLDDETSVASPADTSLRYLFTKGYTMDDLGPGHPGTRVDYERKGIHRSSIQGDLTYVEATSETHCHKLQFLDGRIPESYNGLSGAPVLGMPRELDRVPLVGMALRGGHRWLHIVEGAAVREAVVRASSSGR